MQATREAMWQRLGQPVDLLVIGGGITGAGVARDAARRGMQVALVEQSDLAGGTSSRSSKLVHGGLRYLERYELGLVFESVSERRILMDLAPHLVNPLGFLFPVYRRQRPKLWMLNAGMWLYDGLSLFRSPKIHRQLNPKEALEEEPLLRSDGLKGAPLYYDCSTDDARLTLETGLDAIVAGAALATWCRAESFLKEPSGRVRGVVVKDLLGGGLKEVTASAVVNATGPWTDRTRALSSTGVAPLLRPTKGIHIVLDHARVPVRHTLVCMHPRDHRLLFVVPWGDRSYVGTTDTDYEGEAGDEAATLADVDYLLEAVNHALPAQNVTRDDVIATWAGLRPLIAPGGDDADLAESQISREHRIVVGHDGLITIAGGKLTTYRRMAGEVVDTAVRLLQLSGRLRGELRDPRTDREPLPGGVGWPADDDHDRVAAHVVDASGGRLGRAVARHLVDTYGMRALGLAHRSARRPELAEPLVPGRPEILGQVDVAVEEELAATIVDVLVRRTQLFYRDFDQGLGCAPRVADRMAELIGWDAARREAELDRYRDEVARSRRWRSGVD
jgi:glycerol-3-phosphate dehydrogenase